jgi:hypothetical protein
MIRTVKRMYTMEINPVERTNVSIYHKENKQDGRTTKNDKGDFKKILEKKKSSLIDNRPAAQN